MADDGILQVRSSTIIHIMPITNDNRFECGGGDARDKSFENLSKSACRVQSNTINNSNESNGNISNESNGTKWHSFAFSNRPTGIPSVLDISPVKLEIVDDSFVAADRRIKVEPSLVNVEQSAACGSEQSPARGAEQPLAHGAKQSLPYSSDVLFREHADVVDKKDDELQSLLNDQSVDSRSVYRCGVCSKEFRYAGTLRRHEKFHVGGLRKARKKRRDSVISLFTRNKRRYMQRKKLAARNVHENRSVGGDSIENLSGSNNLDLELDADRNENPSVDQSVNSKYVHSCKFCSKWFRHASGLQRHQDSHLGIRQKRKKRYVIRTSFRKRRVAIGDKRRRSSQNQSVGSNSIGNVSDSNDLESHVDADENVDSDAVRLKCDVCDKLFRTKRSFEQHKHRHRGSQVASFTFNCSSCFTEFESRSSLKSHNCRNRNVDDTLFKCSFCDKTYYNKTVLQQHSNQCRKNPDAVFKCAICTKEFESKYLLKNHEVLCGNGDITVFKCTFCPKKQFDSSTSLSEHESQCSRNPVLLFKCAFCPSKRQTSALLKQHENQCRNNPHAMPFKCTVCSEAFGSKYFLTKHEQTENHGAPKEKIGKGAFACLKCNNRYSCESYLAKHRCKPYACDKCDKSFSDELRLKNHAVVHAVQRPYSCGKCDKRFTVEKSLKLHELTHSDERPFPCTKCDKSYVELRQLAKHEETHAYDSLPAELHPYACTLCPKRFVEKAHLNMHVWRHTNSGSFACDKCDKKYAQATSLESHMLVHTGEKPYSCPKCGKPFRVAQSLKYHMLTRHMERPYCCETCGKSFSVKSLLEKHTRSLHRERDAESSTFMCTQCGKEMSSAHSLKVHEAQHTGKRYACDECEKSFSHPYSLKLHKVAHKEKPFACPSCDERFSEPAGLNQHVRQSHVEERPHMCPKCGQTFHTQTALIKHEECHKAESQFQCALCGARFADAIHLERHKLKAKCANRKYVCTMCGQKFASASMMNVHVRTHTGERPFKCEQCYKSFTVEAHLKEHVESVHCLERPFQCLKCPRSFPTARYLKAHDRKHQTAKSFVCNLCGKSFSASCGLKQHIRMHNGERPFGCKQCSKRFTQQSGLHHHIVLVHGDKVRCGWNEYDLESSSTFFDTPNASSSTSSNTLNFLGEYSTVETKDETNALNEANTLSGPIRASKIIEQTSGAGADYFAPSPTNAELNDDGLINRIDRAILSLFPKTEPKERSLLSNSDANKRPVKTAVRKSKNTSRKLTKKVEIFLPPDTDNAWRDVEAVAKTNYDKLTGELMKTSPDPTFSPPGLSSSISGQLTKEENFGEMAKQLIDSDDDTVIDDNDDRFNNDDNEDSDDYVRPSDNNFANDSRNDTVRSTENNVISMPERNDAVILSHNDKVRRPREELSSKRTKFSRSEVLGDDSDDTVDFNDDLDAAVASESLAAADENSGTAEPSSLIDAQPGDGRKKCRLKLLLSRNKDSVNKNKMKIKFNNKRKRNVVRNNDECKSDVPDGSESAPKRRKRSKRTGDRGNRPRKNRSFFSYKCPHCNEDFTSAKFLIEHAKDAHGDLRPFKCPQCSLEFASMTGFSLHELHHSGARPYACTECDKTFRQSSHLQGHVRIVHFKERPFACALCDKRFPLRTVLKNHERAAHSKVRKYICDQCGKGCMTAQALQIHSRLHTGERPYACAECGASFHQPATLNRHMSCAHGHGPRHMCVKCGKTFSTTTQRNRHESKNCRISAGLIDNTFETFEESRKLKMEQGRFPCETCGRRFTQHSSLKTHNLIHTGERPYPCHMCNKSFRHNSTLKDHTDKKHGIIIPPTPRPLNKRKSRRKKTQEEIDAINNAPPPAPRDLCCALCDKSYNIATCLRRHIRRVHEGIRPLRKKKNNNDAADEKPYVCAKCGACLGDALSLESHLEEHDLIDMNSNDSDKPVSLINAY